MEVTRWLQSVLQDERALVMKALESQHDLILQEMSSKMEVLRVPDVGEAAESMREEPPVPRKRCTLPGQLAESDEVKAETAEPQDKRWLSPTSTTLSRMMTAEEDFPEGDGSCGIRSAASDVHHDEPARQRTGRSLTSRRPSVLLDTIQQAGIRRANGKLAEALNRPVWHPGRFVGSTHFDVFFCIVILLNTIVMGFELQYDGLQRGYELNYPHFTRPARDVWPHAEAAFVGCDWVFGFLYVVEIIIRVVWSRWAFIWDISNWFDTSLVLLWMGELTLSRENYLDSGVVRTLRLARVLRLAKIIRTIQGFDALYIMTTAMSASLIILFWSFVLLLVVQTTIALSLTQILGGFFQDSEVPASKRVEVFEYFGTASRAMFTMFELTLANWTIAGRTLSENVSEYFAIFNVAYKLVVGFAAVGIINAVFMQETFKVAASDDTVMMRQKERERRLHTKKMKILFEAADESGDGVIDREEFRRVFDMPEIRTWLAAQDLPVADPDVLFKLLDDGDNELTAEELVKGVDRLKGAAKSIDLEAFIMEHRSFAKQVCSKLGLPEVARVSREAQGPAP
ncbi:unnamed protein product [Effrenium voratum]|uniref:EF-hand domain-containing protein n=1 Tax=Effrenium voratum TaxID=2562239 RepID=A0AA36JNH6_9DINO|nr:unnamed protein product [Effrenium voratum]CAJ1430311.1 unnamed protein product [Effrenium voratum]